MRFSMSDKVLQISALVMFALLMFLSGTSFAYHHPVAGVVDLVLATFWLCILLLAWSYLNHRVGLLKATVKSADDLINKLIEDKQEVMVKPVTKVAVTKVKVVNTTKKVSPKIKVAPAKKVSKK